VSIFITVACKDNIAMVMFAKTNSMDNAPISDTLHMAAVKAFGLVDPSSSSSANQLTV
jgi:hypothetical protein